MPKNDSATVSNAISGIPVYHPETTIICVIWHIPLPIVDTIINFFIGIFNKKFLYTNVLHKNDNEPHIVSV